MTEIKWNRKLPMVVLTQASHHSLVGGAEEIKRGAQDFAKDCQNSGWTAGQQDGLGAVNETEKEIGSDQRALALDGAG